MVEINNCVAKQKLQKNLHQKLFLLNKEKMRKAVA